MIHPWRWPSSTASSTAPSSSKSTASPTVPTAPVPRRRPQPSDTPCVTATTASVRIAKTHRQAPMLAQLSGRDTGLLFGRDQQLNAEGFHTAKGLAYDDKSVG